MNWDKVVSQIPTVVENVRDEYQIINVTIKDNIFGILEKYCNGNVVYYPIEDNKNRGFHTKRYVKETLEDFVYINTSKSVSEQVFAAAHELGHVWGVVEQVLELAGETRTLSVEEEERIVNRFAAELLMPKEEFEKSFWMHFDQVESEVEKMKMEDLIRVIVMQMNDYMVPYEAVKRRLEEIGIINDKFTAFLERNEEKVLSYVTVFSMEQNTLLDNKTLKKTIPGLRNMIEKVEENGKIDKYFLSKIKKDFDMDEIEGLEGVINITEEGTIHAEE